MQLERMTRGSDPSETGDRQAGKGGPSRQNRVFYVLIVPEPQPKTPAVNRPAGRSLPE